MSPELGIRDQRSNDFFVEDPGVLKEIIYENQIWTFKAIKKIQA